MCTANIYVDRSLQRLLGPACFPRDAAVSHVALEEMVADPGQQQAVTVVVVPASLRDCRPLAAARGRLRAALVVAWNVEEATEDPHFRLAAYSHGASAVTGTMGALQRIVAAASLQDLSGTLACPLCPMHSLTVTSYCLHQQLYHVHHEPRQAVCPICSAAPANVVRHTQDVHSAEPDEDRTGVYCIVVARRPADGKFLLVQERQGQGFWFPGGGAHRAEPLCTAAVREVAEEAGVSVELRGILAVTRAPGGRWSRVTFYGEPKAGCSVPKTEPDWHSAGACWVGLEQLAGLTLRNQEPLQMLPAVANGTIHIKPLELPGDCSSWFLGHSFR